MGAYAEIKTNNDPVATLRSLLGRMLSEHIVDAVFIVSGTPYSKLPMPVLITDDEKLDGVDPFAPAAPFNSARQAVPIIRYDVGRKIAIVMRPCEIRALIELAKLKQCTLENTILIGLECAGRMENDDFLRTSDENENLTQSFYQDSELQSMITTSCKTCTHFLPTSADISLTLFGYQLSDRFGLKGMNETGEEFIKSLQLTLSDEPEEHIGAVDEMTKTRVQARELFFNETAEKINGIEKLQKMIATCLNCHNCRVACPVCYCRECVFLTEVFDHGPEILMRRAGIKGIVKLPAETTMFHLTRLAHMSHACVGCGQCTSVCPSKIPVADIFRTVADQVQKIYSYEPGIDPLEPIPYLVYEKEQKAK